MRPRTIFRQLPKHIQFLGIVMILFVFMWMWITPVFEHVRDSLNLSPLAQFVIGVIGVLIMIKYWKLHPW